MSRWVPSKAIDINVSIFIKFGEAKESCSRDQVRLEIKYGEAKEYCSRDQVR